jgi:hypothetical protein
MYDPEQFKEPRNREFFKKFFTNWKNGNLFWWFKDRMHYEDWVEDQLAGHWKDIPDNWEGKYSFVEAIYKLKV